MTIPHACPALPSGEDKSRLLTGVLRAWGKDPDDFEVEEGCGCEVSELFGSTGGIVLVRRRSTGDERLYAGGEASAWVDTLLMDLTRGHFPPAYARWEAEPASQ